MAKKSIINPRGETAKQMRDRQLKISEQILKDEQVVKRAFLKFASKYKKHLSGVTVYRMEGSGWALGSFTMDAKIYD